MSMDTEYPSKLRTVEGELNLQKDSDIWVSDGNVILTAKGPSEVLHGFKCHKSTLAKNSEVFSTMFPLTQPEDAEEYEGLPVVHLTDTPEDVKALLMMLYDPMKCIPQFRLVAYDWTDDLSAVFAPLRLSHKYELDEVHRRLSAFLQQRWPSQLSTWLKVCEHYRISAEPGSYTASPTRSREHLVRSVGEHFHWTQVGPNIDSDKRTPAEVIVLAETTDVPAILPAAYYNLRLWMHDSRPLADATGAQCAEWDLGSCLESLSSYQFFRIVQLNEWLKRVESEVIRKELAHRLIAQCNVASCCNARRAFWKEELAGLMRAGNQLYRDPLRGLDTLNKDIVKRVQGHTPPAIESACSIRMLQEVVAVAKYIWEEMPFVLGIKPRVAGDIYGYQRFFQAVVV